MFFHDQPSHFLIHSQPAGFLLLTRFLLTDSLSAFLVPRGIGPLCFPGFPEFPNPHSDSAVVVLCAPFPSPGLSAQVFPVPSLSSSCCPRAVQLLSKSCVVPPPKASPALPLGCPFFPCSHQVSGAQRGHCRSGGCSLLPLQGFCSLGKGGCWRCCWKERNLGLF